MNRRASWFWGYVMDPGICYKMTLVRSVNVSALWKCIWPVLWANKWHQFENWLSFLLTTKQTNKKKNNQPAITESSFFKSLNLRISVDFHIWIRFSRNKDQRLHRCTDGCKSLNICCKNDSYTGQKQVMAREQERACRERKREKEVKGGFLPAMSFTYLLSQNCLFM